LTSNSAQTQFAPAARSSAEEIARQAGLFSVLPDFKRLTDFIPDPLLVLNRNRQIVFANQAAVAVAATASHHQPFGLRPGEALNCRHAGTSECGCGTSSFCRYCGAVRAILSSLAGEQAVEECRLTQEDSGDSFLFLAYATPYRIGDEPFAVFMLRDITGEKRRQMLERIFFHDVRNTLTALDGWVSLLGSKVSGAEMATVFRTLNGLSRQLIDEIRAQEQLVKAENHTLSLEMEDIDSLALLKEVHAAYSKQAAAENKTILIAMSAAAVSLRSDASLLKRVLGNMVKNALEAVGPGESVKLDCSAQDGELSFRVHNAGHIPPDVQSQIFKISFSTKGTGRGLGTYSMRLLSERYLNGKVSFVSSPGTGTVFTASYPISR
jgi:signal transduction histidine kinase